MTPPQPAPSQPTWLLIVLAALAVLTAFNTFLHLIAKHTKTPLDDEAASYLDRFLAWCKALLGKLNAVNRDLGLPEMGEYDPAKRGAADSGFVAAYADTLGGMGIGGGGGHAAGEWADLSTLDRQALRSAVLISRLSREPR